MRAPGVSQGRPISMTNCGASAGVKARQLTPILLVIHARPVGEQTHTIKPTMTKGAHLGAFSLGLTLGRSDQTLLVPSDQAMRRRSEGNGKALTLLELTRRGACGAARNSSDTSASALV